MEAKRVVFVSLKSSNASGETSQKNRRKRALGIEEGATWEEFEAAVRARLQIAGVRAVYHASTGERVRAVEDVRDIEDLIVEEDEGARMMDGSVGSPSPLRAANVGRGTSASGRGDAEDDDDGKSKPKRLSVMLANVIPGLGNAVSDGALRRLDSALDAAERGDESAPRRSRFFSRASARAKTTKRKRRLSRRALLLFFALFIAALVYFFGRRAERDAFDAFNR